MWDRETRDVRRLGDWTFELRDDEIADLQWQGRRVLRSIRAVVRDRDWDTAAWTIDGVAQTPDVVTVLLRTRDLGVDIAGEVRVTAAAQSIDVTFDAIAGAAFDTNRTGLVVLHPPQVAGSDVVVGHGDGTSRLAAFPTTIAPHQPVRDIARLEWEDAGLAVDVRFEGDVFEMEDQRNWTDASFKTYSRPLGLPFPYPLAAGERITQIVHVAARPVRDAPAQPDADTLVLSDGGAFPAIGLGAATAPDPAPGPVPAVGTELLVELDLASPAWRASLERAAAGGLPLDVRLVIADADPAGSLAAAAAALAGKTLVRVAAFWPTGPARHVSDAAATALLREALRACEVQTSVVGGARSHFTELNRERHRLPPDLDGITFSLTPLFHSRDTEQLIESLDIQRIVATQAVTIAGTAPVHVGPITLRPHFNDVATTSPPQPTHPDLREGYGPQLIDADDPRQSAPELAAWTIASAAAVAVPGVVSLSFFEEWGPRGVRSATGTETPAAGALHALAALAGTTLLTGASPDGMVWALGGRAASGVETVLVANTGRAPRTLRVETPAGHAGVQLAAGSWMPVELGRAD